MIKKIMIEQEDKNKLLNFEPERLNNVIKLIETYTNEPDQNYVIGLDIASANSKDKSVMVKFRVVGNKYIYEGCEEIWLNSNAISDFINNKFAITGVPEISNEENETIDINGLTFSELTEDLQDTIKDYSLTVYYFDGI